MIRKNFIARNEGFLCEYCGEFTEPQIGSCRNHCTVCLWSKHVDFEVPGDRMSDCGGLMEPIAVEKKHQQFVLTHKCTRCKVQKRNVSAPDDNKEVIIALSKAPIRIKNAS